MSFKTLPPLKTNATAGARDCCVVVARKHATVRRGWGIPIPNIHYEAYPGWSVEETYVVSRSVTMLYYRVGQIFLNDDVNVLI